VNILAEKRSAVYSPRENFPIAASTGPSPIYYGSGYISRGAYWVLGLAFGVISLGVLLLVGVPYLRFLNP
jgi:di/tricarboxylate transporter